MQLDEVELIERRLKALEWHNRCLRASVYVLAVLLAGILLIAAGPSSKKIVADEIIARSISVRASEDSPQGILIAANEKLAGINVAGVQGNVTIVASGGSSGVLLSDTAGEPRAGMSLDSEGAKIRLHDRAKHAAVQMAVEDKSGYRGVEVYDSREKLGASLSVLNDGPVVRVQDKQGYRAELGTSLLENQTGDLTATSAASVKLFDRSNALIWSAPQH